MYRAAIRRTLAVLLVTGTAVVLPAQAGDHHRGYRDWGRHDNHYSHYDRGYAGHGYGRHRDRYRGYDNYYRGHGGGHHYRSHGRNNNRDVLYLAGGLILGSALTHAYHNSYSEPRVVRQPVYREVVYDSSPIVRSTRVIREAEGRRLFRDRNGDCFERTTSANGEELLVELDPSSCSW